MARSTPEQRGWYFYDWANSVFPTTVVTVFLGPYLTTLADRASHGTGHVLGIRDGSVFAYAVSLAVIVEALVLPLFGTLADRVERRDLLLAALAGAGSLTTVFFFLLTGDRWVLGVALFVVANAFFGASVVVSNSFLPDLASADDRDRVSSAGWAVGYVGGGLLLAIDLVVYELRGTLGLTTSAAVRICLVSAGVWWAVFTTIPVRAVRHVRRVRTPAAAGAFAQLRATVADARTHRQTVRFLVAYLVYNDGIQTVITLAAVYGDKELGLSQTVLISAILVVQFAAAAGSRLLAGFAERYGAYRTVLGSLVAWLVVVSAAYFLPHGNALAFLGLGVAIALVLGGSQALSRSLYSHLIPPDKKAQYFSLSEIGEHGTSFLGTLLFGVAYDVTGSYRNAIGSLVVFFVVGGVLLARVDVQKGAADVGNDVPARA